MAQSETQPEALEWPQNDERSRPRLGILGRVRSWLWGDPREPEPISILQVRAEWAEYQIAFNDLLQKFSALLARQAKAEKARVDREAEPEPIAAPVPHSKAALRSALAQRLYGDRIAHILATKNGGNGDESFSPSRED